MNSHIKGLSLSMLLLLTAHRAYGQSYEDISREIGKVAAEQMELQGRDRDRSEKLNRELASGRHDTPEMKATRARIKQLTAELQEAESELRQQFEELPAFKKEAEQAKRDKIAIQGLDRRRQELLKQREDVLKKHRQPAE